MWLTRACLVVCVVLVGFVDSQARGQCADLYITTEPVAMVGPTSLAVLLDHNCGSVQAWSYGVCNLIGELSVVTVNLGSTTLTANGGNPPGFESSSTFAGGWSAGVVIDLFGVQSLAPGTGYELHVADYNVTAGVTDSVVCFCDTLGSPPVNTAVIMGGSPVGHTETCGGVMNATPVQQLIRGDCNEDGSYNIADAITLLGFLFPNPPPAPPLSCDDACDCNDDEALNIADGICILNGLFGAPTVPPVAPHPSCGPDPDGTILECAGFAACP